MSPGFVLRQAREARGLSIEDVAQALKLAVRQVEAIEEDAFDRLRGLTFARGFVRNYARMLDLDPQPLLDAISPAEQSGQVDLTPLSNARGEMPTARNSAHSLLPAALTVLALASIAFAGWYLGWFRVSEPSIGNEVATGPGSSPQVADLATSAVPMAEPTVPPASLTPSPSVAAPVAGGPSAADVAQGKLEVAPGSIPGAEASSATTTAPAVPAVAATPGSHRLAFRFDQDSWVEVRDAAGAIVYSKLHKAGGAAEVDVKGKPPFALVIGNAQHVELRFDQQPVDLKPYVRVSVARLSLPLP